MLLGVVEDIEDKFTYKNTNIFRSREMLFDC